MVLVKHRYLSLLPVHDQAQINGSSYFVCEVSLRNAFQIDFLFRSLKMDKWKLKELKACELGGNARAREYYEQNAMMKDGKPDHEAAPHARYKMELAATCEKAISE